MSVDFNFNPFGKFTAGNNNIKFEDIDKDANGVIDENEFNEYKKLLECDGEDSVSFSNIDRNKDKSIDTNELKIFEQKILIQNIVNDYKQQIAKDFAGQSKNIMTLLQNELKYYVNDFVDGYSGDIDNMSDDFKKDFPDKYQKIKTDILGTNNDKNNVNLNNYTISSEIINASDNQIINAFQIRDEINAYKDQFKEQLKSKLGEKYNADIDMIFGKLFSETIDEMMVELVTKLYSSDTARSFLNFGFNLNLNKTYNTSQLLDIFDDKFNNKIIKVVSNLTDDTKVTSKIINVSKENQINRTDQLKDEINSYKEEYRAQLKSKLGEKYNADIDKIFDKLFSETIEEIINELVSDFFSPEISRRFLDMGADLNLNKTYNTSQLLDIFVDKFNSKMTKEISDLTDDTKVTSKTIDIRKENQINRTDQLKDEINSYREEYRAQLKSKLGEKYNTNIDMIFDKLFNKTIDEMINELVSDFFSPETTKRFLDMGANLNLNQIYNTSQLLDIFDDRFNNKLISLQLLINNT